MAIHLSLALILSFASLFASETYIVSYRAQIKNAVVIHESFTLSPAMHAIKASAEQSLTLDLHKEDKPADLFKANQDEIIRFLGRQGLHTRSHERVIDNKSDALVCLSLPPTYVTVEFKNDYAIITRLNPVK